MDNASNVIEAKNEVSKDAESLEQMGSAQSASKPFYSSMRWAVLLLIFLGVAAVCVINAPGGNVKQLQKSFKRSLSNDPLSCDWVDCLSCTGTCINCLAFDHDGVCLGTDTITVDHFCKEIEGRCPRERHYLA